MNYYDLNQENVIDGTVSLNDVLGVPQFTGVMPGHTDVLPNFGIDQISLVFSRPPQPDWLYSLHKALSYFGINGAKPSESSPNVWRNLIQIFYNTLRDQSSQSDNYGGSYELICCILRLYADEPFGCPIHTPIWPVLDAGCDNYDNTCVLCAATFLLYAMNLHRDNYGCDTNIRLDYYLTNHAKLLAFAFHIYNLAPNSYLFCSHDVCMTTSAQFMLYDTNLIHGRAIGSFSTRDADMFTTLQIHNHLLHIRCPLMNSMHIFNRRIVHHTIQTFDYGRATRVVNAILSLCIPGAQLLNRAMLTPERAREYRKLTVRIPDHMLNPLLIRDIMLYFPTVMIDHGILGFKLNAFNEGKDNAFSLTQEWKYKHINYRHCITYAHSDQILFIKNMHSSIRPAKIIELSHQIIVNNEPISSNVDINHFRSLRAFEMAVLKTLKFSFANFPSEADARMKSHVAKHIDLVSTHLCNNIYNIFANAQLNNLAIHAFNNYNGTGYKGNNPPCIIPDSSLLPCDGDVQIQYTLTYHVPGFICTLVLPTIQWTMIGRSVSLVTAPSHDDETVCDLIDMMNEVSQHKTISYIKWKELETKYHYPLSDALQEDIAAIRGATPPRVHTHQR